jgi:hypothetical protein
MSRASTDAQDVPPGGRRVHITFSPTDKTLAEKRSREKAERDDRYFRFVNLSGEPDDLDIGRAHRVYLCDDQEHEDELLVLTEDRRWVLLHTPFDVFADQPAETRTGIELGQRDATWWLRKSSWAAYDSAMQTVMRDDIYPVTWRDGLPEGLTPVVSGTGRIDAWRRGEPAAPEPAAHPAGQPVNGNQSSERTRRPRKKRAATQRDRVEGFVAQWCNQMKELAAEGEYDKIVPLSSQADLARRAKVSAATISRCWPGLMDKYEVDPATRLPMGYKGRDGGMDAW